MTKSNRITVGPTEHVDFPELGLFGVPAKVDTGADSSAIWASEIKEGTRGLSFILFGKDSPLYTGKKLSTKDYKVVTVKNSFGHSEYRYKAKLQLRLKGRLVNATFTLANRHQNRFPILIGRRTLSGKFIVDVSIKKPTDPAKVLMLSTKQTSVSQRFAASLQQDAKNIDLTYATYDDLRFEIMLDKTAVTLRSTGQDIADFDLVYFKTTTRYMDVAAATAQYLAAKKVAFTDQAIRHFPGTGKLYQYVILAMQAMPIPHTLFFMPAALPTAFDDIVSTLGLPFVLKDNHGNKGEHNYLIRDEASYIKAVREAARDEVQCLAQEFIENDGDYRVLVFGQTIGLAIERHRSDDTTHLNNTSQGAAAQLVEPSKLPLAVQRDCRKMAKIMERQIAGVDMVYDKARRVWYCLEVNDGPQLASGAFTAEKSVAVANYLERKVRKGA